MNAVVVVSGERISIAVLDAAAEGVAGIEQVSCGVCGAVDELDEAYVVHTVKKVLGVQVGGVFQVEIEVVGEYVIFGVNGEGGDEVSDEVAEVGLQTRWSILVGT